MLYDITCPLSPGTPVFPGDAPVSIVDTLSMRRGDPCNVTALSMSAHAGTHIDAPRHYAGDAIGVDALDLAVLVGPACVVTHRARPAISLADAQAFPLAGVERLLVHTGGGDRLRDRFDPDYAWVAPEAADWLGACGVRLIGVDAPSVDPADSVDLPAHKAFLRHGTLIVENLWLRGVPDGDYELVALPLRIVDGDAAPARAILRPIHNPML